MLRLNFINIVRQWVIIGDRLSFWGVRLKNSCIICGEREGVFSTVDGFVCRVCMPKELLEECSELNLYQIKTYHKANRGNYWENCESVESSNYDDDNIEDRCRVITTFDDIILKDELNKQASTAESIDIVVSFILCSGLNVLIDSLRAFTKHGKLRVITTSYMGTTEFEALEQLIRLPNTEVKIELNSGERRLHAKAFLFNRSGCASTVYVGSANISYSALTTGEEWEVKIREQDMADAVNDVRLAFDGLWNSPLYTRVTLTNRARIEAALEKCKKVKY